MSDDKKYQSLKSPIASKTIWVNFLMAAAAFYPPVQAIIQENPGLMTAAIAGVNWVLRFITKDKISL